MSDAAIWAARLGDGLEHTSMMADIVGGVLEVAANVAIGALATAAVVAATGITVATGGLGACVLGAVVGLVVGVVMAKTGADTGLSRLCESIGNGLFPPSIQATITTGSKDTHTNNLPAARAAGWVPPGVQVSEEEDPEADASYWDMAKNFFSQMWRPTVAVPAPGAQPLPEDEITCTKHPPMPPQYLAEGSDKVTINGQPAVRSGDRSTCEAVVVSAGPISPDVRIGGDKLVVREIRSGKTPGVGLAVTVLMMLKGSKGKFLSNLPCMLLGAVNAFVVGQATNALTRAIVGSPNPVHAPTGAKVLGEDDELDFVLPALLPIDWQRVYNSHDARCDGLFGAGWSVAYEVSVEILAHADGGETLLYIDEQGRRIDMGVIPLGGATFSAGEGLCVRRHASGQLLIESDDGLYRLFEPSPLDPRRLRLTLLGERNDNRIHLDYDDQGRLRRLRDNHSQVQVELGYSERWPGRVSHIERLYPDQEREVLCRYAYDAQGDLAEVYDANGQLRRRFAYDQGRRMIEHQRPGGLRCFYTWGWVDNREWRVVRHWTDDGDEYHYDYDLQAGRTTVRDGLGRSSTRVWNAQHQVTEYRDHLDHTWRFDWDDERQLIGATDPQGGQYRFDYDDAGNLTASLDPLGRRTSTLWLEHWALPLAETDAAGQTWQYRYDARGNCIRETDPLGQATRYRYDAHGQVVEIIDAADKRKQLQWNAFGQLVQHTDCSGYPTHFAYDRRGNLQSVTDALGERTLYHHDAQGRLLGSEQPDGRTEQYQRDASGQLVGFTDAAGYTTRYRYDRRGQVRQRLDSQGRQVQFDYDAYGRLLALGNENGEYYRFAWDAADRLVEQHDLDGARRCYAYDACDQLTRVEHHPAALASAVAVAVAPVPAPLVQTLERDAAGRLLRRRNADGCTTYRYDALDRMTEVTFTDLAGETQTLGFAYDALGQLVEERSGAGTLCHQHDELGNLIQTQLPDGRLLNRLYYGSGHLHQINLDGQVISDFERDRLHREVLRTQGQLTTRSLYDRAGRVRSRLRGPAMQAPQLPAQAEDDYQYDAIDNLVGKQRRDRQAPGDARQLLGYDSTGRIIASQDSPSGYSETFAWDAAANLLDAPRSGGLVRHNRLLTYQDKRYRYDAFGRMVEKRSARHGVQQFSYDAQSRLVEVRNANGNRVRMHYDPLGRRIAKTELHASGLVLGETRFIWDGMRLLQEQRNHLTSLYLYNQGSFEPLARVDGLGAQQRVRYYHNDPSGLPQQLTDRDGQSVWQAQYQVWGNTLRETRAAHYVEEQNLRFQGQYLDRETGLHYNTLRFFDPDIGRFTTQDPIGLAGGLNLYAYAPNPLGWADPLGLSKCGTSSRKRPPGPTLDKRTTDSFTNGKYTNRQLTRNERYYKYHGVDNRTGRKVSWLTNQKYTSEDALRRDLAIRHDWGVKITKVSEFEVPKGTWVSEGPAALQGPGLDYPGGGYQAVITNLPRAWVLKTTGVPW
ncbi:RHS repeat-associated core domain-containing protein [Pseudomonas sp. DTU_2021_1001937_2_SI_NGA_ILE_001]|uniref:RHS repeat-associated core domain-containing protein n=1 Tax=Pseudomonas sp. DTU_2021_1001937_2_SI_NGA_ILE_001 TaxID=3077589 RepID=UPI0028FC0F69|nr:RHS repeat-associated core domain-containing protein [Pseudomonas sp. DTU_2021_1001937_2_SI_NGA_ILE_001]WNW12477.1 RHS repeat-associated core domain-containing protein [Pseudomonas sp. DTU_2021_1001937_2_SI_NGA_ILE_001]